MSGKRTTPDKQARDISEIMMPEIVDMIETGVLQDFQNTFADAFGMSAEIRDLRGTTVTTPSGPAGSHEHGADEDKCVALALKATESGSIEQARDKLGFLQFAAPINIEGRAIGVLLVGHIPDEHTDPELVRPIAQEMDIADAELGYG